MNRRVIRFVNVRFAGRKRETGGRLKVTEKKVRLVDESDEQGELVRRL